MNQNKIVQELSGAAAAVLSFLAVYVFHRQVPAYVMAALPALALAAVRLGVGALLNRAEPLASELFTEVQRVEALVNSVLEALAQK